MQHAAYSQQQSEILIGLEHLVEVRILQSGIGKEFLSVEINGVKRNARIRRRLTAGIMEKKDRGPHLEAVVLSKFMFGDLVPVDQGSIVAIKVDHTNRSARPLDHTVIPGNRFVG